MAHRGRVLLASGAMLAIGAIGLAGLTAQPPGAPPKARYVMDVATTSGFMGGGNPLAMLTGRGNGVAHTLTLRLGSSQAVTGTPSADHFMPASMRLGASVPLETPRTTPGAMGTHDSLPEQFRRPKGRLLLFWGCGAHAGPGQPVVIDFSKVAAGQMPPHLFSADVPADRGPSASNSRTFGEWPNGKATRNTIPEGASLIGDHRVAGNYSPQISFALAQDFMPGIRATSAQSTDGSVDLSWQPVDAATGYYAWIMGARGMGEEGADMVWWTSAARQEFGGGLTDWLSPATVTRLIGEKIVMPPSQTRCSVPAEVKAAAGEMMMAQLVAYGPEIDFAYPPRPARAAAPWNPEWTARVRYRSNTSMMLGMPGMDQMMRGDTSADERDRAAEQPQEKKRKCKPSLGGLLKGRVC